MSGPYGSDVEDATIAALEAVIDAFESRLAEVRALNLRVRDGLAEMAEAMRLALDDGTPDVLRSALTESIACLMTLINSADASAPRLVSHREGDS